MAISKAYEQLGIKTDQDINNLLQGIDLSRFNGQFINGYTNPEKLYSQNPNENYASFRQEQKRRGRSDAYIEDQIKKYKQQEASSRVVSSQEDIRLPVAAMVAKAKTEFKKSLGRDPTQDEIASVINSLSPQDEYGILNAKGFAADPLNSAGGKLNHLGLGDFLNVQSPKFSAIDRANLQLQNYGGSLPQDVISKILANDTTPYAADVLANTYIQTAREKKVNESLAALPGEETTAINQLESDLTGSNNEYLQNKLIPSIVASLNARGLATGGDLSASIAEAGAGLQRGVQGTIAPLRADSALGNTRRKADNILRGALEAGQSLSSAMDFTRSILSQDRQNQFSAGQADLNRSFQQDMFTQQQALQLAMMNAGQSKSPSALDYFLQYGLPVLGTVGGAFLGGPVGASIGGGLASAGGNYLGQGLNSGATSTSLRGFTPRDFASYAGNYQSQSRYQPTRGY